MRINAGFIMKLRLSQQQDDDRPTSLTLDFFTSLMGTESKRTGIFQIISFTRKRERVYSTKLNDGFFTLKVMIVNQAADQLDQDLIKPFYLIEGNIRNHGEGVIVIKEPVKYWEYGKDVGQSVPWRLKKENVNYKGSNLVVWSTQKIEKLHENGVSQIMIDYGIQASSKRKSKQQKQYKPLTTAEKGEILNGLFTSEKKPMKSNDQQDTKSIINEKMCEAQTLTINQIDDTVMTPNVQNKEQRFQNILELLVSDRSDDENEQSFELPPKKVSQKKMTTNKKKLEERKRDLQFIFNCLSDNEQQEEIVHNVQDERTVTIQKFNEEDDNEEWDFFNWVKDKKSQQKLFLSQEETKQTATQDTCKVQKSKSLQMVKIENIDKNITTIENLYHGYVKKSAMWQIEALIKCLHAENNIIHSIICDKNHQYLIFAAFINLQDLSFSLQENRIYKLGRGIIRQSISQRLNYSNYELQFDCRTCILQERQEQQALNTAQPSQNYTPIDKIYQLEQGLVLSCFGILKDFKSFKGKNGSTIHFEIVDPITRWSISYVQFQSRLNTQSIRGLLDKTVTIYGAMTSSYKNKANLVRKPFTIVRHEWLPLSKQAMEIVAWTNQCSSVAHLDTELIGYTEVNELKDIEEESGTNFFVKNVKIIEFKDKYTYRACVVCFKKVEDNRCRTCGPRKNGQAEDRLFLRGEIGDSSATISVIWSNSTAETLMMSGFWMMKKEWLLRPVSVWVDKSNNNAITIVKMRVLDSQEDLSNLLKIVNQSLLSH